MAQRDQPITGFEGVQDSLLYDTMRQAEYQKRVLEQRAIAEPFDRAIDAFGNFLSMGVDQLAPPLAQRNARAVTEARANALRSVEGQEFESPYLRQVAVVEAAADELDRQGLGSSAEQLRANALQLRTQALEFMRLNAQVTKDQAEAILTSSKVPYAADMAADEAATTDAKRRQEERAARVGEATETADVDKALAQSKSAQFQADVLDPLQVQQTNAQIAASYAASDASRESVLTSRQLRAQRELGDSTAIATTDGTVVNANVLPDGRAVVRDASGKVLKVYGQNEFSQVAVTGGQNEVSATERKGLRESLVGTSSMARELAGVRRLVAEAPDVGTGIARAAGVAARLRQEGQAAARALGGEDAIAANEATLARYFDQNKDAIDRLQRMGISRDVFVAMTGSASYAVAGSRENGRFTDKDVENAGRAFGLGSSTPQGMLAAMDNMVYNVSRSTRQRAALLNIPVGDDYNAAMMEYTNAMDRAPVDVPGNPVLTERARQTRARRAAANRRAVGRTRSGANITVE
mgnify:CR=1 FL=1